MALITLEFWELLLDVIGMCICGVTILYLIKNSTGKNKNVFKNGVEKHFGNFSEALLQLVRQSEMAFATMSDTLKIEHKVLREFIGNGEIKNGRDHLPVEQSNEVPEHLQKRVQKGPGGVDYAGDQYGEVVRLANLGMSVNGIYERVRIPKSEIELIIRLRKKGHEPHRKDQAKTQVIC